MMPEARKTYEEAVAPTQKTYAEARTQAQKTHEEAITQAEKTFNEVLAPAEKAYDKATDPARKAYEEAEGSEDKPGLWSRAFAQAVKDFVLSRRDDIEKDVENFGILNPVLKHFLEEASDG